jgi:DNA modification methylase
MGTRQTADDLERRTAAYPAEIADRLIKMFSTKGDIVLDPFLGSGTTARLPCRMNETAWGMKLTKMCLGS